MLQTSMEMRLQRRRRGVDNSRATHDPHETFEGKTWLEYASANKLDLGANGEVSRMWERQWRAKAQQERDKAGWAEPPGPKRVRVPSDVHGGDTSGDVFEDEDDVAGLFGDFDQEAPSAPGASGSGDPWRPRDEHGHVIETLIGAGCDRDEAVRSVKFYDASYGGYIHGVVWARRHYSRCQRHSSKPQRQGPWSL